MSEQVYKSTARIRLTIDVESSSVWADDVTVQQVRQQAARESLQSLENVFRGNGVSVVGQPVVTVLSILKGVD